VTDMSLPSKLTSYFAAGRPVIAAASAESETAREINAAGAGSVVAPDDPAGLRNAILSIRKEAAMRAVAGENARRYADHELSPDKTLADYERFVAKVAAGR
jgi:colanic acid biosynthesis glycosyl transferase WcaI